MRPTLLVLLVAITANTLSGCSVMTHEPGQHADWVLTDGQIYTVDAAQPWAEAVAIRGNKLVYVGSNHGAQAYVSAATRRTDLAGRMVIPGIVDAHTHPGYIEVEQYDATIEAQSRDDFFTKLEAWASRHHGKDWARVWCWPNSVFVDGDMGPDRRDLDRIFPDRPVWITSCAWHSYWLNSKALEKLGITDDVMDPKFPIAVYKRDASGRLTGWLKEAAGWRYFPEVFALNEDIHQTNVKALLKELSSSGVTALYDAGNSDYSDYVLGFFKELEQKDQLPIRYQGTYMIATPSDMDKAVSEMKRYKRTYSGERMSFNTIKLFMDGVHENRSAALLEPYADDPSYSSDTLVSVETLTQFLITLHQEQFDLHVHVIGDLAVRRVLDAVESARDAVGEAFYPRVSMGHLQTIHPDDWSRFGELGVGANFTPWWHGFDDPDPVGDGLGSERDNDTYRVKALLDGGANVTFSSDNWTLGVMSPFLGIQVGHTRQYPREWLDPGADPSLFRGPSSEKLPLEAMIKGYTLSGAYQLRLEDQLGSLEVGKLADLVVLPQNLFEMNQYEIHTLKPDAVVMEGQLVHGALE